MVELSDVIIQVLDARDPLATRCADVERYVRSVGTGKKIVLVLNKIGTPPLVATLRTTCALPTPLCAATKSS